MFHAAFPEFLSEDAAGGEDDVEVAVEAGQFFERVFFVLQSPGEDVSRVEVADGADGDVVFLFEVDGGARELEGVADFDVVRVHAFDDEFDRFSGTAEADSRKEGNPQTGRADHALIFWHIFGIGCDNNVPHVRQFGEPPGFCGEIGFDFPAFRYIELGNVDKIHT